MAEQNQINDILEEIETYRWILNNTDPAQTANIADTKETIERLQKEVQKLLGEPVSPPRVIPEPAHSLTSPSRSVPQTPQQPPQHTPFHPPQSRSQTHQISHSHHPRTLPPPIPSADLLPSTPGHWPSSAPSPFGGPPPALANGQNEWSFAGLPSQPFVVQSPRKRDRQDSIGLNAPSQPPKKTAVDPTSQMEDIQKELSVKLEKSREHYERRRDPTEVRRVARREDVTEAEVLEELDAEEENERQSIKTRFQMKIDELYALSLQAQENSIGSEHYPTSQQSSYSLPSRPTLTQSQYPHQLYHPTNGAFNPGTSSSVISSDDEFDSEGFEEISPDFWNSRFGHPTMPGSYPLKPAPPSMPLPSQFIPGGPYASQSGHPSMRSMYPPPYPSPLLGSSSMPRSIPWLHSSTRNSHPEMKVFDLVREQQEMDDDTVDFDMYKEEDFPEDIKTLLTGIKDINQATKIDKDDSPAALKVTLMKHQKIGLAWLKAKEESAQKGGILADDMGLGKTIQTIALMVARPATDPDRHPCLIVAPKALMDQWRLEIGRHVKPGNHQLRVLIFHASTRGLPWKEIAKYDVVITTFGTLTANHKIALQADEFERQGRDAGIVRATRDKATLFTAKSKWHRVIIDEAQNIKNPSAKSNKACCSLNSTYRWCLTGTPMMNRLEDFQALLSFLRIRPYNNKDKFRRDFTRPLKSGYGDEKIMAQLRVLVKSVCLRRTKKTKLDGEPILQLPPKVIEKIHVVFNETESAIYNELNSNTQRQVTSLLKSGTFGRNYSHVLVLLLRLRQACDHPHLITAGNSEPSSAGVEGVDLCANAKLLAPHVVERLKEHLMAPEGERDDDGACPVCFDVVENSVIYIPCGHSVCSECFAKITDPALLARQSDTELAKCQNCRGPVDPKKITDANSFKKVFDLDSSTEATDGPESATETAADTDSASETEFDEYDSDTGSSETEKGMSKKSKPQKKSLAQLRAAAQKNKGEKSRYLRRLEKNWVSSAKIDKTIDILQANEDRGQGEKTIIFSQFTSLLDLLEVPIMRRGWGYMRFDGSMNITDRNKSVATFTDNPDCRIMLVSLKAGNAGLNLVAASHVIIFDPFWNPYVEDQAIDRAHRIGQSRDVFVHRLLIENTVEDRIIELQDKKRDLISGALDEGGSMNVSRLDARELAYLFGVRA